MKGEAGVAPLAGLLRTPPMLFTMNVMTWVRAAYRLPRNVAPLDRVPQRAPG
jgi:hypothetical protein